MFKDLKSVKMLMNCILLVENIDPLCTQRRECCHSRTWSFSPMCASNGTEIGRMLTRLICDRFFFLSHHRRRQALNQPCWSPHCCLDKHPFRAAVPGCEGNAVAAGGAAEGEGREKDRWDVDTVHPQGSASSHGPLHLLGGELPTENLHLRLCER